MTARDRLAAQAAPEDLRCARPQSPPAQTPTVTHNTTAWRRIPPSKGKRWGFCGAPPSWAADPATGSRSLMLAWTAP